MSGDGVLKGKVAIVTGGSRGIGAATVLTLLRAGASVMLTYHVDEEGAAQVEAQAKQEGLAAALRLRSCDVRDYAATKALVAATAEAFGGLDLLINNAGVFEGGLVPYTKDADYDLIMDTNVRGPFLACKVAIPELRAGGAIINVASVAGVIPFEGHALYNASKAALVVMSATLAQDLAPTIRVNCIAPGAVVTKMTEWGYADDPKAHGELRDETYLRRWGQPQDVADLVLYLASDASSYVTGATIRLDGGLT